MRSPQLLARTRVKVHSRKHWSISGAVDVCFPPAACDHPVWGRIRINDATVRGGNILRILMLRQQLNELTVSVSSRLLDARSLAHLLARYLKLS